MIIAGSRAASSPAAGSPRAASGGTELAWPVPLPGG
jgi:hypothetical protein